MTLGLIELPAFYLSQERSATRDVRELADELRARGATVLVLDLRGNGGGVVAEALTLTAALAGRGPLGYERDADGQVRALRAAAAEPLWPGPLVVAVDRRSASMAEVCAGALQDRGIALIVGERTFGKGLEQTLVLLSSPLGAPAGAVQVTERAFYRLDGALLEGRGVTPDVLLSPATSHEGRAPSWLPARIELPDAPPRPTPSPHALEAARAAAAAPSTDELERLSAIAAAYATALEATTGR